MTICRPTLIIILFAVLLVVTISPAARAASDEEVQLIREIEEVRYTIDRTEWTWSNREEKKALEDQVVFLNRVLTRVNQHKRIVAPTKGPDQPPSSRELSSEEVRLIREIEELKEQIAKIEWRWDNRDQKTVIEKRIQFLEATLAKIGS